MKERFSDLALADPIYNITALIDILLGGDMYPFIMTGKKIIVGDSLQAAFSSIFGWVLIGPVSDVQIGPVHSLPVSLTASIKGLMAKFWYEEEPIAEPENFTDEGRCEAIFRDQYTRLPSGRFSVPLPFREPVSDSIFIGSRDTAVQRFESLKRKLSRDRKLRELYVNFMRDYISLGHMSIAATSSGTFYIPHHAVYRPDIDNNKINYVWCLMHQRGATEGSH
jgi:hypothetical protein